MFSSKLKTLVVPVYIDDLLPMGDEVLVNNFIEYLPKVFKMSSAGEADFFLGMRIERLADEQVLCLDQYAFIKTLLDQFKVPEDSSAPTPLSPQEDLVPSKTPISEVNPVTQSKYQSVIGSLMYLMLGTRPDLAYAVGKLARFSTNPSPAHFNAADRVLWYINGTKDLYLDFDPGTNKGVSIDAFTNADWAQSKLDRKSTSGYFFYINGTVFSWLSKKQSTVAMLTMEAEYIGLFHASQQAAWTQQFLAQVGQPLGYPIEIYCNSEAAQNTAAAKNPHKLLKHLDVKYHSIREHVEMKTIKIRSVPTANNTTDLLTKSLPVAMFWKHYSSLGLEPLNYDEEEEEVDEMLTPPLDDEGKTLESETRGSVEQ